MAASLVQLPSIVLIGPTVGCLLRPPFAFQGFLELLETGDATFGLSNEIGQNSPADRGDDFPSVRSKGKALGKRFSRQRGPHAHGYPRGLYRNSISPQHSKRARSGRIARALVRTTRRNAESFRPPRHGWTPPREERSGLPIGSHSAATV